jgi:hypothetical protein
MKSDETGRNIPRWAVGLALLAWLGFLAVWTARAHALALSAETLRNWVSLTAWVRALLWQMGTQLASFVPVGFLSVLCLPPRESWLNRTVRRWIPAVALSFLLAALVRALHARPAAVRPFAALGILGLLVPWTGCLLGTWAGMAWARGTLARILFLPKLALLVVLLAGCAWATGLRMAIEASPTSINMPKVTSADRRHLYDLFAGKSPLKVREGNTVTLRLTAHDLNLLLAWGLSVEGSARRASVEIEGNQGQILASIPMHGGSKFVNITVHGSISLRDGKLELQADRLRVGRVEIPPAALRALSPVAARTLAGDPRLQPILERLRGIELQAGELTVTYGHGTPTQGLVSRLFHDQAAEQIDVPAVHAQIHNLIAAAPKMPRNSEARFGAAVRAVFRFAQERTSAGPAAEANRSAVLALGIALGHAHVETLIGRFMDESTRIALRNAFQGTTIRKRDDWPKHFFVSAALTLIAAGNASDASGLLKEEKDSAGGSGFSFGDLLADRAGTTFAQVATRDEASAVAMQTRLAQGFKTDDFFPEAADLPEGIQETELQTRYGGVGGEGYGRLTAEIERRIARCPGYASTP